jgi:hypothetical protein
MKDKYFISFIEEFWTNIKPEYKDYVIGRVEVYDNDSVYAIDEIRFLTNDKNWNKFREKWDFKDITKKDLNKLRKEINKKFYSIK